MGHKRTHSNYLSLLLLKANYSTYGMGLMLCYLLWCLPGFSSGSLLLLSFPLFYKHSQVYPYFNKTKQDIFFHSECYLPITIPLIPWLSAVTTYWWSAPTFHDGLGALFICDFIAFYRNVCSFYWFLIIKHVIRARYYSNQVTVNLFNFYNNTLRKVLLAPF